MPDLSETERSTRLFKVSGYIGIMENQIHIKIENRMDRVAFRRHGIKVWDVGLGFFRVLDLGLRI